MNEFISCTKSSLYGQREVPVFIHKLIFAFMIYLSRGKLKLSVQFLRQLWTSFFFDDRTFLCFINHRQASKLHELSS